MPTKRCTTTIVTSKEHLIVAGGRIGPFPSDCISTVEVMDTKTLVWSTVADLPHPYNYASGTICGDQLYVLGGWDDKGMKTKSVLTCSLQNYYNHHHHHHQYGTELLMPQLTTPPVQLSMESYWQLVDVTRTIKQWLLFTSTTRQLTHGISSSTCQLLVIGVLLQSSQPMR